MIPVVQYRAWLEIELCIKKKKPTSQVIFKKPLCENISISCLSTPEIICITTSVGRWKQDSHHYITGIPCVNNKETSWFSANLSFSLCLLLNRRFSCCSAVASNSPVYIKASTDRKFTRIIQLILHLLPFYTKARKEHQFLSTCFWDLSNNFLLHICQSGQNQALAALDGLKSLLLIKI